MLTVKKRKLFWKKGKSVKESYKDSYIGKLTTKQIKCILSDCNVAFTREQNNKADLLVAFDKYIKESAYSSQEELLAQYDL